MNEEFLYYIWQHYTPLNTLNKTVDGEDIVILSKGERNRDAGPDFFNAKIKINDTIWVGNVELHLKSSNWEHHSHQNNPAYNNVILHVVQKSDKEAFTADGRKLPCLELKNVEEFYQKFKQNFQHKTFIPCEANIGEVNISTMNFWLEKMIVERWEEFYNKFQKRLSINGNDWEKTFYQLLLQTYGLKANTDAFEQLSRGLPLKVLIKHKDSLLQIEALLFGQAGFLTAKSTGDDYYKNLVNEYTFLSHKYNLKKLQIDQWKFLRLRPANFPTIRLAQFSALIYNSSNLFSQVIEAKNINELRKLLSTSASNYWDNHYNFNKVSKHTKSKKLGIIMQNLILINCFLPTIFSYGQHFSIGIIKERSLSFLSKLPSEKNRIINMWNKLGIKSKSAFYSQSLLQLKQKYCNFNLCLSCSIGHQIFKRLND